MSSFHCTNDELMTEWFLPQSVYASLTVNSLHKREANMEIYYKAIWGKYHPKQNQKLV